jgi:hypothetical protein
MDVEIQLSIAAWVLVSPGDRGALQPDSTCFKGKRGEKQ